MQQDRRYSVISALIELAASDDVRDRADAGRALAWFAETAESREPLVRQGAADLREMLAQVRSVLFPQE